MHIRSATPSDIPTIAGLITEVFELRPGMGAAYAGVYRALMAYDPAVSPDCSRVAERDAQVIGHALVIPRTMEVSGIEVPAGLVAFVVVRETFRGQGVGSALMEDAVRWMRGRGHLLSHLSGAPGFYRRFGYVPAYRRSLGRIPAYAGAGGGVFSGNSAVSVREATVADSGALCSLFAKEHEGRTGGIRREAAQWAWQLKAGHPGRYAARNEGLVGFKAEDRCLAGVREGKTVGYLRLLSGPGHAMVHEGAAADEGAASALMAFAGEAGGQMGAGEVELLVPSDGTIGRWAAAHGAVFAEGFDPEALVKTLDAPALLARLGPALTERVQGSALRGRSVRLVIETEAGRTGLDVTPEGVAVGEAVGEADWGVRLPEIGLTQMILGTRDYASVVRGKAGAEEELADWIGVLFSEQRPYICLGDMF